MSQCNDEKKQNISNEHDENDDEPSNYHQFEFDYTNFEHSWSKFNLLTTKLNLNVQERRNTMITLSVASLITSKMRYFLFLYIYKVRIVTFLFCVSVYI